MSFAKGHNLPGLVPLSSSREAVVINIQIKIKIPQFTIVEIKIYKGSQVW
jgi:hypothetical protein